MHYSYSGAWNFKLRKPLLGHTWLDEVEARERWEAGQNIDVVVRDSAEAPAHHILTVARGAEWQTVQRLDRHGSVVARVDLRAIDDRLFCDRTTTWTYPNDERFHRQGESVRTETSTMAPDGTGTLTFRENGEQTTLEARGIQVDDLWAPQPEFGHWDALVGIPMTSSPSA